MQLSHFTAAKIASQHPIQDRFIREVVKNEIEGGRMVWSGDTARLSGDDPLNPATWACKPTKPIPPRFLFNAEK